MVLLRNNFTNLRQPTADRPFELPKMGLGLQFLWKSTYQVELQSNHISGKCYVPVTNGSGDDLTLSFDPGAGITLSFFASGANGVDSGSVAAGNFYQIRVISKRGSSPALLAHTNGKIESGGSTFTLPSGYTHYSDVVWGVSYTKPAFKNFTFTGIPDDEAYITLIDNNPSGAVTKKFVVDDAGKGTSVSGGVAFDPSAATGEGGTADKDKMAAGLAAAINGVSWGITASSYLGDIYLYQSYGSEYTGAYTGESTLTFSDIGSPSTTWQAATSTDVSGTVKFSSGIQQFYQVGPGECRYTNGENTMLGEGLQVLWTDATSTTSVGVGLERVVHQPVVDTDYESRGTALVTFFGQQAASGGKNVDLIFSEDGRLSNSTYYGGTLIARLENLGTATGGETKNKRAVVEFPLVLNKTNSLAPYYRSPEKSGSITTTDPIMQYKWSDTPSSALVTVNITGWKLNG